MMMSTTTIAVPTNMATSSLTSQRRIITRARNLMASLITRATPTSSPPVTSATARVSTACARSPASPASVPTTTRSVDWSAEKTKPGETAAFDPFQVVSHDGFEMKVEVRCQYRILPENAPSRAAFDRLAAEFGPGPFAPIVLAIRTQGSATDPRNLVGLLPSSLGSAVSVKQPGVYLVTAVDRLGNEGSPAVATLP